MPNRRYKCSVCDQWVAVTATLRTPAGGISDPVINECIACAEERLGLIAGTPGTIVTVTKDGSVIVRRARAPSKRTRAKVDPAADRQ
jgi:hypothetical protein